MNEEWLLGVIDEMSDKEVKTHFLALQCLILKDEGFEEVDNVPTLEVTHDDND